MSHDNWAERCLEMAALVACWSKYPKARVGAVIVRNNRVVATDFNGFPCEVPVGHLEKSLPSSLIG